jgi:hypothetical protein
MRAGVLSETETSPKMSLQKFLAWIIPAGQAGGGTPEHPIVIPPDGPGDGGTPEHPIVPPGGYPHPEHPIAMPPGTPVYPALPIVLPPYIDNSLPIPPPVIWPPRPDPPPGGQTGSPSHPINLPPATGTSLEPGFWAEAYLGTIGKNMEVNGWVWVWVPIGSLSGTGSSTASKSTKP